MKITGIFWKCPEEEMEVLVVILKTSRIVWNIFSFYTPNTQYIHFLHNSSIVLPGFFLFSLYFNCFAWVFYDVCSTTATTLFHLCAL